MRVLDAGCGYGRNLVYLLREGIEVFAIDADPNAVAGGACPRGGPGSRAAGDPNFQVETVEP